MRENITHDALLALHSNVRPVGDIGVHSTIRHRRCFEGNDRCRSGGNSATGADPHRLSGIEMHHTARAGINCSDDGPRARAADHPPVHRRRGESRQIRQGHGVAGQSPSEGIGKRHFLARGTAHGLAREDARLPPGHLGHRTPESSNSRANRSTI